jgi:aminopeptidase N
MKTLLALTLSLSFALPAAARQAVKGLSQEAATARASWVSKVHYDLQFALSAEDKHFTGVSTLNFTLKNLVRPLTIDFNGGDVRKVEVNGKDIAIDYNDMFITIPVETLKNGRNKVVVAFAHPYSDSGAGLYRFKDPADNRTYLYSDFEPYDANRLFPCFDQPDLKATYAVDVIAPQAWKVITSNHASKVTQAAPGKRRWIFPKSEKFSTYIFSLHAGPYVEWTDTYKGMPLGLYARHSMAQYVDVEEWMTVTKQGFGYFNKYFAYKYPFHKYDQLIVPDFNAGAMENVGAVTFSERYIPRSKSTLKQRLDRADVILHEMAHMWFGNLTTMKWWDDLWLNESFASLMSVMALSQATEFKDGWLDFYQGYKQWAYWEDQLVTTHPIEAKVPNTAQAFANFDGITYGKGASSLKQVAYYLGATQFRNGTRRYFKNHAFSNATRKDFVGALAKASGKNLNAWTKEWLQRAGLNTLSADYACSNGKISRFSLKQEAPSELPTLRSHRTAIGLFYEKDGKVQATRVAENVAYRGATTQVKKLLGAKCPLMVFPNYDDHDYVKVRLDERTLNAAKEKLSSVTRELDRAMLWMTMWEMVQHADFPVSEYAELVQKHLPAEKNLQIQTKIAQTVYGRRLHSAAILSYLGGVDPVLKEHQLMMRKNFSTFFAKLRDAAAPGSDAQKLWFDSWVRVAFAKNDADQLESALRGKTRFKGLELDQDRRWALIKQMSRAGHKRAAKYIKNESKRDKSRRGQTSAIGATVLSPMAKSKQLWLNEIGNIDTKKSLAELRAAMDNIFPPEQDIARRAWSAQYLNKLPAFAKKRAPEFLGPFAQKMVPAGCRDEDSQDLEKFVRNNATLDPVALKKVRVALQENVRCVKVRRLELKHLAGSGNSHKGG